MVAHPQYPSEAFERRSGAEPTEPRDHDPRSPFAKDRDRIIYSSAFRRLAGKSQVVSSTEIGTFHTRLTHSLKVAQLGRRLAERFRQDSKHRGSYRTSLYAPDPDLVEFACLSHDIGHPPFGHAGEEELNDVVDQLVDGDPGMSSIEPAEGSAQESSDGALHVGGFEGNPQTFRIVTRLAHKWLRSDGLHEGPEPRDWFGLDITAASMDAVSKYPWPRLDRERNKWGVYGTDECDISDYSALKWARHKFGAILGSDATKSFECQLMDWCDDVTYAVHDVEDFFRVGLIPLHLIFWTGSPEYEGDPLEEWFTFKERVKDRWNEEGREFDGKPITDGHLEEVRRRLLNAADGLTIWRADDTTVDLRYSHYRANQLIEHFTKYLEVTGEPMLHRGDLEYHHCAEEAVLLRHQCDLLKELIREYVIMSPSVATQQAGQRKIIRDLVTLHFEDVKLLPRQFREIIDYGGAGYDSGMPPSVARIRVVADYVSSLTEPHAIALHRRLTGINLGGFRDIT